MDDEIRKLVNEYYDQMMNAITEPEMFAHDISVLTPVDLERIKSEARERGSSTGVFELLNRLQKRGPLAFQQLLDALRNPKHNCKHIAEELEREAISRGLYRPVDRLLQSPYTVAREPEIVARGPWQSPKPPQAERSLSSPVQPTSLSHQESTEEMYTARSTPMLFTQIDIPRPEELTPYEESMPQKTKMKGKESFLKDIPSNLKDKIVNMLNNEDALGNDWKGVAGELQLTAEQQGQVKSCSSKTSPMDELFNQMLHREYRVSNLINILKKIHRQDVIAEINAAGFKDPKEDDELPSPTQVAGDSANKRNKNLSLPKQASDDCIEEEKKTASGPDESSLLPTESIVKEKRKKATNPVVFFSTNNSTVEEKKAEARSPVSPTRSNPHSENSIVKELDEKKKKKEDAILSTTGLPSPTEVSAFGSDDTKKTKGSSSTAGRLSETEDEELACNKQDGAMSLPSPTQVSEFDSFDGSKSGKKKEAHLSQEIEDAKREEQDERDPVTDMTTFEEEVFLPDAIQAKAFFITCEKYKKMTKLTGLTKQVKKLAREMEDNGNWEVDTFRDYDSATLMSELTLKLRNFHQRSDFSFVYLIYLAGHTLQINGENYFLPKDVELNLAAADIMDSCLNINKLIKDLSDKALMALIIVDGGHQCEEEFECPFALPGLTSIIPLSNTVIAFPCQPGYIRPPEESLLYLKALTSVVEEKKHLALTDLFGSVREALKGSRSLPVEFSLSPSLLPIFLNTSEEDDEGIAIRQPDDTTPRRAIVFCDESFDKKTVSTTAGHLEASLKQLGWKVEKYSNLNPEQIKAKIRQSLNGLPEMNVFMLYFIGYVPKDKDSIGQDSWEVDIPQKLPIQWLVNIMSQFITGPKVLIVDYSSVPVRRTLSPMTALPQEVLVCLPKENRDSRREEKNSFTLLFAQNLAAVTQLSLKAVISTTAKKWKYEVDSMLFYA